MKAAIPQPILHTFIKYELLNLKLVLALNKLGLCADEYQTHLIADIFTLMGHTGSEQERETLYDGYRQRADTVLYMDTRNWYGPIHELATEIYTYLHHHPKPAKSNPKQKPRNAKTKPTPK